jgi:oxygen-dependent protoporphyrinogen oxidase
MARIIVIGGGITGLAAAHRLRLDSPQHDITLVEAADRCGGHVHTVHEDGFVVEAGPNAFLVRTDEPEPLALVRELGLESGLVEADRASRRRYVWRRGRLRTAPASPLSLLSSDAMSLAGKLRLAAEPFVRRGGGAGESVHAFATRRLGREAAEALVDPAVAGITAGDSRELEVAAAFPALAEMEREHGSLLRALLARRGRPPRLVSLAPGMGVLAEMLSWQLDGRIRLNARVLRIARSGGAWRVLLDSGEHLHADGVVVATSAADAAAPLAPHDSELAYVLSRFPQSGLAVVAMGFRAEDVPQRLNGYGFLAARGEGMGTLGAVWESSLFAGRAPEGHVLVRAMLGGSRRPDLMWLDEQTLLERARGDLATVMGISALPVRHWVWRWPRAITQYTSGHLERVARVRACASRHPGLELCGTSYDGVSFTAAIVSAERAVARLLDSPALAARQPAPQSVRPAAPARHGAAPHLSLVRTDRCADTSS